MASNRITPGGAVRRGLRGGMASRAVRWATMTAALLATLAALAGCGGGGSSSSTEPAAGAPPTSGTATDVSTPTPAPEESPDAGLLNHVLGRQEAVIAAYDQVIPKLPPRLARMAAYFRAQEQEHLDAVMKAMRGVGGGTEPSEDEIDVGEPKSNRERLELLYEIESATIDEELSAISQLEASWPRSLLSSTVANQAQHLTLLRQALGAGPLASVPVPFEDGTAAPPE